MEPSASVAASVPAEGGPLAPGQPAAPQGMFAWYAPGFSDALGDRLLLFDNTDGRPLELLRLRADFARSPEFEAALRERARDLSGFEDPHSARVCRVDRLPDPGGGLAIVSEHVEGPRLSELLTLVRQRHARLSADLAVAMTSDLLAGVAALHRRGEQLAHGALGPERIVLAPGGRLLLTEYVLGQALAGLEPDRTAFWRDLRIALPDGAEQRPFGQGTDLLQVGLTALALLLARPLERDEYPGGLADLLEEAGDRARLGGWEAERWLRFRGWLDRLLAPAPPACFADAVEAKEALDQLLAAEPAKPARRNDLARLLVECTGTGTPPVKESAKTAVVESLPPASTTSPAQLGDGIDVAALPGGAGKDLLSFPAEGGARHALGDSVTGRAYRPRGADKPSAAAGWQRSRLLIALLSVVVVVEGAYLATQFLARGRQASASGTVRIESNPAASAVMVDGTPTGTTPATLRLSPGRHVVELVSGSRRRSVTLTVEAGASSTQYLELPAERAVSGQINIRSEPAGAAVLVDGQPRGTTPVVVAGLPAGEHQVRIERRGRSVMQAVNVAEGQASSLFVPFPGGDAPLPGWLSVRCPVELQVYEDSELLGTSRADRLMLPAGRHEVTLVSELVGFRQLREVQVPVGRMATLDVEMPNGTMDINATPWAEVWVDGEKVGETPLAGVSVKLGRHSVRLRHPTLGERTVDAVVVLRQPARVSADLRK